METQNIATFAAGSTYTEVKFRYHLVMWITTRHRPFSIVEDPEFRVLLRMLYGRVEIPSHVTVTRDMHLILEDAKGHLTALMRVRPTLLISRLHTPELIRESSPSLGRSTCALMAGQVPTSCLSLASRRTGCRAPRSNMSHLISLSTHLFLLLCTLTDLYQA